MRPIAATLVLALMACAPQERLPPGPGGGGGGGSSGGGDPDAGPPDAGPVLVSGQACRVIDLRTPLACVQNLDMSGISVTIRGRDQTVETDLGGLFAIELDADAADSLVLEASGPDYQPTVLPLRAADGFEGVLVPIVDSAAWLELLTALGVIVPDGLGNLAIYLEQDGFPVIGGQVVDVSDSSGVYYEAGGGSLDWITDGLTGASGAVLVFGANVPVTRFTAIDEEGAVIADVDDVPVGSDAITFVTVDLTPVARP